MLPVPLPSTYLNRGLGMRLNFALASTLSTCCDLDGISVGGHNIGHLCIMCQNTTPMQSTSPVCFCQYISKKAITL